MTEQESPQSDELRALLRGRYLLANTRSKRPNPFRGGLWEASPDKYSRAKTGRDLNKEKQINSGSAETIASTQPTDSDSDQTQN